MRIKHSVNSFIILSLICMSIFNSLKLKSKNIILSKTVPGFINDFLLSKNSKFGVDKKGDKHKLIEYDVSQFTPPETYTDFTVKPDYPGLDGQASPLPDFVQAKPFVRSDAVYSFKIDNPVLPTGSRVRISIEAPGSNPIPNKYPQEEKKTTGVNSSVSLTNSNSEEAGVNNLLLNTVGSGNESKSDNVRNNIITSNDSISSHVSDQTEKVENTTPISSNLIRSVNTSSQSVMSTVTGSTTSSSGQLIIENGVVKSDNSSTRTMDLSKLSSTDLEKPVSIILGQNSENKSEAQKVLETIQSEKSNNNSASGEITANNLSINPLNSGNAAAVIFSPSSNQGNISNSNSLILNTPPKPSQEENKVLKDSESLDLFNPMASRQSSQIKETIKMDRAQSENAPIKINPASSNTVVIASESNNSRQTKTVPNIQPDSRNVLPVIDLTKVSNNPQSISPIKNPSNSVNSSKSSATSPSIVKSDSVSVEDLEEFKRLPSRSSISENSDRSKNITLSGELNKTNSNKTISIKNSSYFVEMSISTILIILTLLV